MISINNSLFYLFFNCILMESYSTYCSFCVWFISFNIMSEIHPLIKYSVVNYFSCCIVFHCINIPQFIYSFSVKRSLSCFQFGSTMNKATMHIPVHVYYRCTHSVLWVIYPGLKFLGHRVYEDLALKYVIK